MAASNNHRMHDLETFENNDGVIEALKQQFSKLIDDDIIESVAYECNYNVESSRKNLMEMAGFSSVNSYENQNEAERAEPQWQTVRSNEKPAPNHRESPHRSIQDNVMNPRAIKVPHTALDKAIGDAQSGNLVLILLRGLPGSGKSTMAKRIVADAVGPCNPRDFIFSSDDFLYKDGVYQYNGTFISDAHLWNQRRVYAAIQKSYSPLIIDNTNTEVWEMKAYCGWAVAKGYIVHVLEPNTSWAFNESELARRNTHGVPRYKIREMLDRYSRNITVESLFRKLDLRYDGLQPPQLRKYPPIVSIHTKHTQQLPRVSNYQPNGSNFYGLPSWEQDVETAAASRRFGEHIGNVGGVDKMDAGTCTRDRDLESRQRLLPVRNYFVNNGQLPPKYPREGHFDKSTTTEDTVIELECAEDAEDVGEVAIDHLQTIFENVPRDCLKDILDKCNGDVQWSIDLLLDDKKEFLTNYQAPYQIPNVKKPQVCEVPIDEVQMAEVGNFGVCTKETKNHLVEQSMALKKHLESNVVISREHYTPNLLKLKGMMLPEEVASVPGTSGTCAGASTISRMADADAFVIIDSDMEFDDDDDDDEDIIEITDDVAADDEEMIELNMGDRFVEQLNERFGDPAMKLPIGFQPVMEIPKALGQQLYALYLESMFKQMEYQEDLIQNMIKEDEHFALTLQEEEVRKLAEEQQPPDLKQIMKDQKEAQRNQKQSDIQWMNLTPDDIAYKMTVQKLSANFPEVDVNTLSEILQAHDNSYEATVKSLAESGQKVEETVKKTISAGTLEEMKAAHEAAASVMDVQDNPSHVLRQEAANYQRKRKELLDRAKQYYGKGMYEVASFYSGLASKQTHMWEKYNHLAAVQIVSENFKRVNSLDTIDLHHLHVPEALNSLDIYIDEIIHKLQSVSCVKGKNHHYIHVITGRGKNSPNGIARIRPNVMTRLRRRKLKFVHVNPGLLKVKIMKNSLMSAELD